MTPGLEIKLRGLKNKQTLTPNYRVGATVWLYSAPKQRWRGGLTSNKHQLARLSGYKARQSSLLRTGMKKRKQRVDQVWWGMNIGFTPEGDKPEEKIKQTQAKNNRKRQDKLQSNP